MLNWPVIIVVAWCLAVVAFVVWGTRNINATARPTPEQRRDILAGQIGRLERELGLPVSDPQSTAHLGEYYPR